MKFHSKHVAFFEMKSLLGLSIALLFIVVFYDQTLAQTGGRNAFEFLNAAPSARLAGLGGVNVSHADRDLNFFFANPALSGDTLNGFASASYQFYVGNIGQAALVYKPVFKNVGAITFGVQNINYGVVKGYDQTGTEINDFHPNETALIIGKNHTIGYYTFGANIKGIFSNVAGYNSTAVAIDVGGVFKHPVQDLAIGLAIKNLGLVITDYSSTSKSSLPFDIQLGTTYKPQHMPVRFSITVYNLTKYGFTYQDLSIENARVPVLQRIFTHINFGGELLIHKHVNMLLGYNYLNHRSQKLETGGKGAGVSVGFALNVKKFDFSFSRVGYVAGKGTYSFTVSSNLNKFLKRQKYDG